MHTSATITQLLKQGEGPSFELKVNTPHPENLSRLISGLANTNGGTVVVGVRNPASILGTDIDRFKRLVQLAQDRLHGEVDLVAYPVEVDGKQLGIIDVKHSKVPVAAQEGYFRRVGDREELLTAQQLVQTMSAVPNHAIAIASLSETIAGQSAEIAKLRESFDKANSWQRKAFYALLGATATAVLKLLTAVVGL
jgi:predicted HTH transcriptional regulator